MRAPNYREAKVGLDSENTVKVWFINGSKIVPLTKLDLKRL
jgi:hypothetical protein